MITQKIPITNPYMLISWNWNQKLEGIKQYRINFNWKTIPTLYSHLYKIISTENFLRRWQTTWNKITKKQNRIIKTSRLRETLLSMKIFPLNSTNLYKKRGNTTYTPLFLVKYFLFKDYWNSYSSNLFFSPYYNINT